MPSTDSPFPAPQSRRFPSLSVVAVAVFALASCGGTSTDSPDAATPSSPELGGVLVDTTWLGRHLGSPGLVVVDTRSADAYGAGHLPGAVSLPYRELFDRRSEHESDVAPVRQANEVFGRAGIDMSKSVVLYADGEDYRPAAWVFWVLELYGHPSVAVLDGGFPGWLSTGGASVTAPAAPTPTLFIGEFAPRRLADKLQVLRAIEIRDTVLLDARDEEQYLGLRKSASASRAGHIPTARNRDCTDHYERKGDFCSVQDVERIRSRCSDLIGKRVLTYCNTGRSAAVSYLALRSIGIDVAVYDGSWTEWSADSDLPIETASAQ